jgi:hypothetical protein
MHQLIGMHLITVYAWHVPKCKLHALIPMNKLCQAPQLYDMRSMTTLQEKQFRPDSLENKEILVTSSLGASTGV